MDTKLQRLLNLINDEFDDSLGIVRLTEAFMVKIAGGTAYANTGCSNMSCNNTNSGCENYGCSVSPTSNNNCWNSGCA